MIPGRVSRRSQALETYAMDTGGADDDFDDFGIPTKGRGNNASSSKKGGLFNRFKRAPNSTSRSRSRAAAGDSDDDDDGDFDVIPGTGSQGGFQTLGPSNGYPMHMNGGPPMASPGGMPNAMPNGAPNGAPNGMSYGMTNGPHEMANSPYGMANGASPSVQPQQPRASFIPENVPRRPPSNYTASEVGSVRNMPPPSASDVSGEIGEISMDQISSLRDRHRYPAVSEEQRNNKAIAAAAAMTNYDTTPIIPTLGLSSHGSQGKPTHNDNYRHRMIESRRAAMSSETGGGVAARPPSASDRTLSLSSVQSGANRHAPFGSHDHMNGYANGAPYPPQSIPYGAPFGGTHGAPHRPPSAQGPYSGPPGGGFARPYSQYQPMHLRSASGQLPPGQLPPGQLPPPGQYASGQNAPNQYLSGHQGPYLPEHSNQYVSRPGSRQTARPVPVSAEHAKYPAPSMGSPLSTPQLDGTDETFASVRSPEERKLSDFDFGPEISFTSPGGTERIQPRKLVEEKLAKSRAAESAPQHETEQEIAAIPEEDTGRIKSLEDDVRVMSIELAESARRELKMDPSSEKAETAAALAKAQSELSLERGRREAAEKVARNQGIPNVEVHEKLAELEYHHTEAVHLLAIRTDQYDKIGREKEELKQALNNKTQQHLQLQAKSRELDTSGQAYKHDQQLVEQVKTLETENANLRAGLANISKQGTSGDRVVALEEQRSALQEALRAIRERKDSEIQHLNKRIEALTLSQQRSRATSSNSNIRVSSNSTLMSDSRNTSRNPSRINSYQSTISKSPTDPESKETDGNLVMPRLRETSVGRPASPLHIGLDYSR